MNHITLIAFVAVLLGCQDLDLTSDPNAIIRGEGIFPIDEVFANLDPLIQISVRAVGQLNGMCTAFHLGGGLVVSAAHCFAREQQPGDPCIATEVRWFDGSRSQCIQILNYEWNDSHDMVVFEVDPAPKAQLSWADEVFLQQEAVVLGFPNHRPLSISHPCKIRGLPRTTGRFFHDCDTLPGNSGSPIINPLSATVIGIHNGYLNQLNYATFPADWEDLKLEMSAIQESRQPNSGNLVFGPFGDLENRLLYHFPTDQDDWVSFTIQYDVENGYDFVNIRDGRGLRLRLTGRDTRSYELKTPVVVSFESDYSGSSNFVKIFQSN